MDRLAAACHRLHDAVFHRLSVLDGLPSLALRLYLAPVLWMAGTQKLAAMDSTVEWFGNADWGLGLPLPGLLAPLAAWTEAIGALLLWLGLATRWIALPLMAVMAVAAGAVHWENGWAAIADSSDPAVAQRLGVARELLDEHGNLAWLTAEGPLVILNNGVEFAITYLLMLLVLFFSGGGRFVSVDYYLARLYPRAA